MMLAYRFASRANKVVAGPPASLPFTALTAEFRTLLENSPTSQQQKRSVATKKRKHRQEKRQRKEELAAKGIFPPKPNNYIPKDFQVINAISREERDAESKRSDEIAAQELKDKMDVVKAPLMRFGFSESDLIMSDRLKKLFDLHNGNQKEVIKAQKQRGMELFQIREGDTGSSAVQGESASHLEIVFQQVNITHSLDFSLSSHCLDNPYSTDSDSLETAQERQTLKTWTRCSVCEKT